MNQEPVLTAAGIAAFVSATLALLVAFGVGLSPDEVAAVMGVTGVVAPIVAAYIARKKVAPVEKRQRSQHLSLIWITTPTSLYLDFAGGRSKAPAP